MDVLTLGIGSLWSGLFAGGLGIVLTAPPRHAPGAFLCGFAGRLARDVLVGCGLPESWSTLAAAAVVVLVGVAAIRGHVVSPVVLVSGVLPLGAALAVFNAVAALLRISTLEGEALDAASVALAANVGKAFTTSLAIALGLCAGVAVVRLSRRKPAPVGA